MKRTPITPARIRFDEGIAFSEDFGDIYHSVTGARAQADHVFLAGNGLPQRWRGRSRFVVLETGFGLGHNFLATWNAWRRDQARSAQLWFVSLEMHPPCRDDLARAHGTAADAGLADELITAWPPLTPDLHHLTFDAGRVHLLLSLGDARDGLRQLVAQVDAFYFDGFAPGRNAAMWEARVFKSCARLAAPDATAATWSVAAAVQLGLRGVGFEVSQAAGLPPKRAMTVARFAPRVAPPVAAGRRPAAATPPWTRPAPQADAQFALPAEAPADAVVIGAGLAGASVARALADQGWRVCVLERHGQPAQETSGNPGGLFHGAVHGNDGAHARLLRAASLRAARVLLPLIAQGRVVGEMEGLLRMLEGDSPGQARALAAVIARQGLPPDYARVLDAGQASRASGLALRKAACLYAAGGWLSPASLVAHWLDSPLIQVLGQYEVASLVASERTLPDGIGAAPCWQACDAAGRVLAQAPVMVLANATDAERLIRQAVRPGVPAAFAAAQVDAEVAGDGAARHRPPAAAWPVSRVRGQITLVPAAAACSMRPRIPLASRGYVIGLPETLGGGVLCGATSDVADADDTLRAADHADNLAQAQRLTGQRTVLASVQLGGRVGWRCVADDRLPVVGPVPDEAASRQLRLRQEQARHVPRIDGLYVFTALGSRGITWAPLLGEALACWISGAPMPLESGLIDAIDVARFVTRQVRSPREATIAPAKGPTQAPT